MTDQRTTAHHRPPRHLAGERQTLLGRARVATAGLVIAAASATGILTVTAAHTLASDASGVGTGSGSTGSGGHAARGGPGHGANRAANRPQAGSGAGRTVSSTSGGAVAGSHSS